MDLSDEKERYMDNINVIDNNFFEKVFLIIYNIEYNKKVIHINLQRRILFWQK